MAAELNCCWHFAQSLGGQDQGPNDAMGENFKKSPFDSLVREAIQNSIDAQSDPEKPVIVSFNFKTTTSNNYPRLFDIRKHIEGCLQMYNDSSSRKKFQPMLEYLRRAAYERIDYLEVSDENTWGMPYEKNNVKCPFYSFVQSAGNSSKNSASAGGSFGFGKAAYFNISRIRTVLISTLTDKGKYYFQGVSSLCTHRIGNQKRVPVGYYGNYLGLSEPVDEVPIDNPDEIPTRFRRDAIGTSMFIMGLGMTQEDLKETIREINEAVVKHFWLAIIRNKLIVNVSAYGGSYSIDANTLARYVESIFPDYDDAKRGHNNPRPYIDAVLNAGTDDKHLVFEEKIPYLGKCALYLIKSKKGNDYVLNLRSTFMLINHQRNGTDYGFYSVFVCTDEDGNEILRSSENPAHTEWDARNAPAQDKLVVREALKAKEDFIQRCIRSVFVREDVTELNFGGLDEFLSIPSSLDDEDYNPDFGNPTNNTTDQEGASPTTDIPEPERPTITQPKTPRLGEVQIKKQKKSKTADPDGEEEPRGHVVEVIPDPDPNPDPDPHPDPGPKPEPDPKPELPEGLDANTDPDSVLPDEDGLRTPDLEPLRISYRTFAQSVDGNIEHRLVIHHNRPSNRVVIAVISGGESSDEPLAISYSDNGNIVGNTLTRVTLSNEDKTIIRVRFADDMRHAIKLNVYETE